MVFGFSIFIIYVFFVPIECYYNENNKFQGTLDLKNLLIDDTYKIQVLENHIFYSSISYENYKGIFYIYKSNWLNSTHFNYNNTVKIRGRSDNSGLGKRMKSIYVGNNDYMILISDYNHAYLYGYNGITNTEFLIMTFYIRDINFIEISQIYNTPEVYLYIGDEKYINIYMCDISKFQCDKTTYTKFDITGFEMSDTQIYDSYIFLRQEIPNSLKVYMIPAVGQLPILVYVSKDDSFLTFKAYKTSISSFYDIAIKTNTGMIEKYECDSQPYFSCDKINIYNLGKYNLFNYSFTEEFYMIIGSYSNDNFLDVVLNNTNHVGQNEVENFDILKKTNFTYYSYQQSFITSYYANNTFVYHLPNETHLNIIYLNTIIHFSPDKCINNKRLIDCQNSCSISKKKKSLNDNKVKPVIDKLNDGKSKNSKSSLDPENNCDDLSCLTYCVNRQKCINDQYLEFCNYYKDLNSCNTLCSESYKLLPNVLLIILFILFLFVFQNFVQKNINFL